MSGFGLSGPGWNISSKRVVQWLEESLMLLEHQCVGTQSVCVVAYVEMADGSPVVAERLGVSFFYC
jgi:hypothetical protein